jgi:hypothetical protein
MKNSATLMAMMAFASMAEGMELTGQGNLTSSKQPKMPKLSKNLSFKNEEGVINTIKDYKDIREGKSKKGISKQNRVKSKINNWIDSGKLNKIDLL